METSTETMKMMNLRMESVASFKEGRKKKGVASSDHASTLQSRLRMGPLSPFLVPSSRWCHHASREAPSGQIHHGGMWPSGSRQGGTWPNGGGQAGKQGAQVKQGAIPYEYRPRLMLDACSLSLQRLPACFDSSCVYEGGPSLTLIRRDMFCVCTRSSCIPTACSLVS